MKLCHIRVWSTLQLLRVPRWIYMQETVSCCVIKESEQIAKQGGSCSRTCVNKCSLVRKCKNSSCLQEREQETRETELGRENLDNQRDFLLKFLCYLTQSNWL